MKIFKWKIGIWSFQVFVRAHLSLRRFSPLIHKLVPLKNSSGKNISSEKSLPVTKTWKISRTRCRVHWKYVWSVHEAIGKRHQMPTKETNLYAKLQPNWAIFCEKKIKIEKKFSKALMTYCMNKLACQIRAETNNKFAVYMNLEEIWRFFKVQKCHKLKNLKFSKLFATSSAYQVNELTWQTWAKSNRNFTANMKILKVQMNALRPNKDNTR